MTSPFLGEIRMFAGTFAPSGWALCQGQTIQVSQNEPLFSVLGSIYGGDGRTTFKLPDLRGRVAIHEGQGTGLTNRPIGSQGGSETQGLTSSEVAGHSHGLIAQAKQAETVAPEGKVLADGAITIYNESTADATLDSQAITSDGGTGAAHPNMMPFQALNFIIALTGLIPTQN